MIKKVVFTLLFMVACKDVKPPESKRGPEINAPEAVTVKGKLTTSDSLRLREYVVRAYAAPLHSREHQAYLDSALLITPTDGWLWQQKAMPLYKTRKYQLGKPFLAKAVEHDAGKWLEYSGFIKCIFSKEYQESIDELMEATERFGDGYVMDHTYNFYIGLDYLQLNEFEKAKEYLIRSKEQQLKDFPNDPPEEACHYLDWFYLGIADFEMGNYQEAIQSFDRSLMGYGNFGDALYFKGRSMSKSGDTEQGKWVEQKAFEYSDNTINEDNAIYEIYPYQVFHRLNQNVRPKTP
ncbi:tetratricopeptide repeat protein [Flavobacteriaceae bacterium TP-CH-4]|uniref:Tetratricopeptide repeat protein n=1 Tax=Pelagihabitans pacificus TaxID=2696054 RepID=A0A967AY28_9FLAO|nr:tetratricopeptide repeat protein [Pelagihabitans pacificus]NHF61415.1 tetratricopeptide repeat protein [Pelagihabitans pacificus]